MARAARKTAQSKRVKQPVRQQDSAKARRASSCAHLPKPIADWFAARKWSVRAHQAALIEKAVSARDTLLIAPTGAGKTLAGFLPSLIELQSNEDLNNAGLHTLYISPLKALAVDVTRNLLEPVKEMGLGIKIESRSGDTSLAKRQRQRRRPPHILLTTPEQLTLLLTHAEAVDLFANVKRVVLDELHALAGSKRGDLLSLDLTRLREIAPDVRVTGLSATVARPSELRAYLTAQLQPGEKTLLADLVEVEGGVAPEIEILDGDEPLPWSGHTARYAVQRIYEAIKAHRLSLLFVNTRSQAEMLFQELWRANDDGLAIALHHGSLDKEQRRKVEAAMAGGRLKAVVATSTLDLGIDWGDVDLVINVGAPKGASRLLQRVGRANHRMDEASRALLVPANRFEVLECRAALEAAQAGAQDAVLNRAGALDVLVQHVMSSACHGPLSADLLFERVRTGAPYSHLSRDTFDRAVDFVATGGYALRSYERYARLRPDREGRLRLSHPRLAQIHRLNIGTIVEAPKLNVRLIRRKAMAKVGKPGHTSALAGGKVLGEIDEYFVGELKVGDTFMFAGQIVRYEGLREMTAYVSRTSANDPAVPSYPGGKFPLSTHLAKRVRQFLAEPECWQDFAMPVAEWLALQADKSAMPSAHEMLVETFPRRNRYFLVAYPFEGRLAHQTLGMLLTRRLQRASLRPLGFVANDYGIAVWCGRDIGRAISGNQLRLDALFDQDMLGDDLETWLNESNLMKRTFRICATIAGLIERRHPGREKSGRQMTVSSDLIYDVLRKHEPGHILLEAAWADAASGLLDIRRLGDLLQRLVGNIRHMDLDRVSPLAVPMLLEIGRESVYGRDADELLRDAARDLLDDV